MMRMLDVGVKNAGKTPWGNIWAFYNLANGAASFILISVKWKSSIGQDFVEVSMVVGTNSFVSYHIQVRAVRNDGIKSIPNREGENIGVLTRYTCCRVRSRLFSYREKSHPTTVQLFFAVSSIFEDSSRSCEMSL